MASGTKLQMTFNTMAGAKTVNLSYANTSATAANVKALGTSFITNGALFAYPPLGLKSAKFVVTTETDVDLS